MATTDLTAGRAMRERQLDFFEQRDADFLNHCRSLAVQIASRQGEVSINDIRKHIQVPSGVHPSVLGAVFRTKQFKKIGLCEASHKEAHARVIRVYALAD
jgi:hypothetical protein